MRSSHSPFGPVLPMDRSPPVDDELFYSVEKAVNELFEPDIQFPVYFIRTPSEERDVRASIAGDIYHFQYRDLIHNWRGPGFVMMFHVDNLYKSEFRTVVAHELAHTFDRRMIPPAAFYDERLELYFLRLFRDLLCNAGTPQNRIQRLHFQHDAVFWRNAFHVAHRMTQAGLKCIPEYLGAQEESIAMMYDILKPELTSLADIPLWKLSQRPVPGALGKLFHSVRKYEYPIRFDSPPTRKDFS